MNTRTLFCTCFLAFSLLAGAPANAAPLPVLVIQDQPPCGDNPTDEILASWGIEHSVIPVARLPSLTALQGVHTIIISSNQNDAFYAALAPKMPRITKWLRGGARTLEFHTDTHCTEFINPLSLPRNVVSTPTISDRVNHVVRPRSELVTGVPRNIGPYDQLSNLSPGTLTALGKVVIINESGAPTLIDYCVGSGRVIATSIFVERLWTRGLDSAQLLPNLLSASTYTPGCSNTPQ